MIQALNRESAQRVDPAGLVAADTVLRAVITGDSSLQNIASRIRPPQ